MTPKKLPKKHVKKMDAGVCGARGNPRLGRGVPSKILACTGPRDR